MTQGVCYIAYGPPAVKEAAQSIETLRLHQSWPVVVFGEGGLIPHGAEFIDLPDLSGGYPGRYAKTTLARHSPFDDTLFLDADTRVRSPALRVGFDLLALGWQLVMVASNFRGHEGLAHLSADDQAHTLKGLPHSDPLQLNTGVMWFRKCPEVLRFWDIWHQEWKVFKHRDQGAFLRALYRYPIKLALLGYPFNSDTGTVVSHRFGQADRGCRRD